MDFYNILELPVDATTDEIRVAYFSAAKIYHPDKNPSAADTEKFLKIQKAYETLIDQKKRSSYDENISEEIKSKKSIQINAFYSRNVLPLIEGDQVFYLLLDIFPTKTDLPNLLPPVNICLVIDKSTSMQGDLIEKIKFEAVNFLKLIRENDTISIVTFSDFADVILTPTKSNESGAVLSRIQSIQASGSTEIYKGLSEGIEQLRSIQADDQIKQLILITDGHTYGDEALCMQLIREATEEGISFQAIGIGDNWNDQFLDELARISGGETQFVVSAQEMLNSLIEKIKQSGIQYARNVKIEFETSPFVQLNYAFRLSPDLSSLDVGNSILLGNLLLGKHLRVIFEFHIDELLPTMEELRMIYGSIKMDIPSNPIKKTRMYFDFKRPISTTIDRVIPPAAIIDAMSHLTLYRIQEKARNEVKDGDIQNATRHLHHVATHLLARGDRNLARTVLQEAQNLQTQKSFSDIGEKRIKYGTRSLLMLPEPERTEYDYLP